MTRTLLRLAVRATFYPSLWFHEAMCAAGVWRKWDAVDECVLVGSLPSRRDLVRLRDLGVGGVVNLCQEFAGYLDTLEALALEQLHLPTLDYHSPSEEHVLHGLTFIARHKLAGARTYVHCKAGRGRSATLAVCWLMAERGIAADQAYSIVRAARPHIDRRIVSRPVVRAIERRVQHGWRPEA